MKIIFLTTQTTHHSYCIKKVNEEINLLGCIIETTSINPKFNTYHPYLNYEKNYELGLFFDNKEELIENIVESFYVEDINNISAIEKINQWNPDIIISYGIRRIKKETLFYIKGTLLNLHGGDTLKYRGLDSHLWAIYHDDYKSLIITLHLINEGLDRGDIIKQRYIPIKNNMKLYQLRAANTLICIELIISYIKNSIKQKDLNRKKQLKIGRYYSFMPTDLKDYVKNKFEKYTKNIL
tara:strand:- start:310 stop:1023 length:714 start_codon:yes stop_codon:yes gene_type:complete